MKWWILPLMHCFLFFPNLNPLWQEQECLYPFGMHFCWQPPLFRLSQGGTKGGRIMTLKWKTKKIIFTVFSTFHSFYCTSNLESKYHSTIRLSLQNAHAHIPTYSNPPPPHTHTNKHTHPSTPTPTCVLCGSQSPSM